MLVSYHSTTTIRAMADAGAEDSAGGAGDAVVFKKKKRVATRKVDDDNDGDEEEVRGIPRRIERGQARAGGASAVRFRNEWCVRAARMRQVKVAAAKKKQAKGLVQTMEKSATPEVATVYTSDRTVAPQAVRWASSRTSRLGRPPEPRGRPRKPLWQSRNPRRVPRCRPRTRTSRAGR
jgi:hypothetical protein